MLCICINTDEIVILKKKTNLKDPYLKDQSTQCSTRAAGSVGWVSEGAIWEITEPL